MRFVAKIISVLMLPSVAYASQTSEAWYASSNLWTAVFTGLLVVVTAVLAWYTYCLYRSTVEIAGASTRNARLQVRAYVRPTTPYLHESEPGVTCIQFHIHNFGGTPAHFSKAWSRYELVPTGSVHQPNWAHGATFVGHQTLGPGQRSTKTIPINGEKIAQATNAGTGRFYFWGEIPYTDVFGEPHVSRYHYFLTATGDFDASPEWTSAT